MKNKPININSIDLRTSDRIIIMLVSRLAYITYTNENGYIDFINELNSLRFTQIQFVLYSNGSFAMYAHDLYKKQDFSVYITSYKQITKIRRALRARLAYITKNSLTNLNKNLINIIKRSL